MLLRKKQKYNTKQYPSTYEHMEHTGLNKLIYWALQYSLDAFFQ